jgi:hypothetical protein
MGTSDQDRPVALNGLVAKTILGLQDVRSSQGVVGELGTANVSDIDFQTAQIAYGLQAKEKCSTGIRNFSQIYQRSQ